LFGIVLSGFFFFARIFLSIKGGVTFEAIFLCTLNIDYSISFSLDLVSSGYSTCIIIVYFCILIFTEFYIKGTTNYRRFIYLMALFVVSILILVMSDSFITLIIG
jgi:NADH:ubiquinone oxidoreductase subunit 5 (subunit L)/multisubunit Na+/H+ antiporter MnhA subunit